jgi:hypothetical protein
MPSGAAVIRYDGKRGTVWRIKYRDATGKQVKETIGAERDGVTRKQQARRCKIASPTFAAEGSGAPRRSRSRSTRTAGSLKASSAADGSERRSRSTARRERA